MAPVDQLTARVDLSRRHRARVEERCGVDAEPGLPVGDRVVDAHDDAADALAGAQRDHGRVLVAGGVVAAVFVHQSAQRGSTDVGPCIWSRVRLEDALGGGVGAG